jgi:drug/metabolite transporter (DMT)-like permease
MALASASLTAISISTSCPSAQRFSRITCITPSLTAGMALASAVFLAAISLARRRAARQSSTLSSVFFTPHPLNGRDRWDLIWLGGIGHCVFQLCFAEGLARTTASNAGLASARRRS